MIKSTNTAAGVIQAWPLVGQSNWRNDYAVGFAQAGRLTREVGSYFFLNRGWRRWRGLFSHAGVIWSGGSWKVQVWFVGGRTPRRTRRWRRIPARVRIKLTRRRRRGRLARALGYRRRRRRHLTRKLYQRRRRQRLQKAISSTGGGVSAPLSRRARQRARKASPPPAVTVKPIHKVSSRQRPHLKNYKNGHQPKDVRRIQKKILSRYPQRFSKPRRGLKSKLGRRRRLRLGKWARLMRMRRHQRRGPLLEIAQTWGTPRGGDLVLDSIGSSWLSWSSYSTCSNEVSPSWSNRNESPTSSTPSSSERSPFTGRNWSRSSLSWTVFTSSKGLT